MNQNESHDCIPSDEVMFLEDETEDELLAKALEESIRYNLLSSSILRLS
jgi:hypothetical protein